VPKLDPQQFVHLVMGIAAFGLVMSVWLAGLLLWWSRRKKKTDLVRQRLSAIEEHGSVAGESRVLRLWHEGREATTVVHGMSEKGFSPVQYLEDLRVQADWTTPLSSAVLGLLGVMALVAAASYLITGMVFVAIAAPAATVIVFWIYLTSRIAKRQNVFERSLIDALELSARSLRAGHPLLGSFQLIADEIPAPVGVIFAEICQQQQLGQSMDEALRQVALETHSDDMKLFATSVMIQLRSGGNLADMMMRLANVIRERNRLSRRVRVLTAQTQLSKRVLLAMPFLVFVLLNIINPTYMQPLYTTWTGQVIMMCAAVGMFLGWLLMNWLSKLSY
jgi:tight adherence protein B